MQEAVLALGVHVGQGAWPGVSEVALGVGSGVPNGQALKDAGFAQAVADCCLDHVVQHPCSSDERDELYKAIGQRQAGKVSLHRADVHKSPFSKRSNLDCTGMRLVRKGCAVKFFGGARARVVRVRLGMLWTDAAVGPRSKRCHWCESVRVLG